MLDMIVFFKLIDILILIKKIQIINMFLKNFYLLKDKYQKIIKNQHHHKKKELLIEDGV